MSDSSGPPGFPEPPRPMSSPPPPPPPNMAAPPGYMSYGPANAGAYGNLRRIGGLAKALRTLLMILIPVLVLTGILLLVVKGKAEDYVSGAVDKSTYTDALAPYVLLGALSGVLQLAMLVLTIIWMFRMAKNQQILGRQGTWGPPWAIAGWFLPPCILYVIPYLMLRDLWKSSDPQSGPDWKRNPVGTVVHLWWVLFGLAPLVFLSVTLRNLRLNGNADARKNAQRIVDGFGATLGAAAVQIAAAVVFFLLVTQLSARHKQTINES